jgi:predicted ATPase/DNA-binding SARP family transcriptional activator
MGSEDASQRVEFHLLGPFGADCGGRPVDVGSGKQRALLAMLLLRLNRVVPRDTLFNELWGESLPTSATTTLHSLVSRTRRALAAASGGTADLVVRAREPGYVLEGDPECLDVHRFEQLVSRAREDIGRGEPQAAAHGLRRALDLWRGDALADLVDAGFARVAANRLEEARLTAVEDLADAELACGRPSAAVTLLEPHVTSHPFRERGWGQLMLALYRLGRQAEALAAYRNARKMMVAELGLEPTPALRRLEDQILHQSAELDGPQPRSPVLAWRPSARRPTDDTVAFLFTDIEASTRRWEGDREAMAQDLARHDELLRRQIEIAGGEVFTHTGDGLDAAFSTASAALAAAIMGQQALLGEQWVAAGKLRVRMAVHAGTAERRGGNYFGPTLNRAARLLATASGAQIICSQATVDLARDDLPAGVSILDLGEYALTDLVRPERIFQVSACGLPSVFPPLRSSGAQRHNLPHSLTHFVGRASELDELQPLLETSRLLTLTGVGGAGKTRLALELAEAALEHFADGVWLVELGPVRDPALVVTGVCTAVGVPPDALLGRSSRPEEQLCAHLRGRRVLILLDNCEHLIEVSAHLVHTVLANCPLVSVLATSREVLGLPGEVVWRVPSLSLPPPEPAGVEDLAPSDAVALFCERARTAQPGFALSTAHVGAVAQICRRLDGIPLALELAAARIRVLSAHQVAERLDDRFRLLTGGARTAVPRHQTLRAAMDWSYEALSGPEQTVLRRLAVFPASFDLDAAEAIARVDHGGGLIATPGFEILDLLSRLVDKSLLVAQAVRLEVRYRLLETVRQYAAERLTEAGEALAAHRRHRDHFVQPPECQGGGWWPDDEAWLRRADGDEDNFRAALAWSLAEGEEEQALRLAASMWLHWYWTGRPEGVGWLERALAGPARPATPARAEALLALGWLLGDSAQPDPDRSQRLLREALELADRLGDTYGQTRARFLLGCYAIMKGDTERAEHLLIDALERCNESHLTAKGWCHYELGNALVAAGDVDRAMTHFEQALALARRGTLVVLTPEVLAALAPLAALTGNQEWAMALADEAVAAAERLSWRRITTMVLVRASEARILAGKTSEARETLRKLLQIIRDGHGRNFVADALETAALVAEMVGHSVAAARLLGTCEVMRDADREPFGGTRALSSAVRACPPRLLEAVGARCEVEKARGRHMSVEDAITYALAELYNEEISLRSADSPVGNERSSAEQQPLG